ncbi:hypothetical protein EVAR_85486_1 [Eumeta japonica]|uniref:Uncharacterized protein n=1 Tax=Eumeta variegata TaxID=151549 RepID=A0A4C1VC91_EUMVA|nr:hypothetical protein EVAR_85486_1 [Eumeta japonica]
MVRSSHTYLSRLTDIHQSFHYPFSTSIPIPRCDPDVDSSFGPGANLGRYSDIGVGNDLPASKCLSLTRIKSHTKLIKSELEINSARCGGARSTLGRAADALQHPREGAPSMDCQAGGAQEGAPLLPPTAAKDGVCCSQFATRRRCGFDHDACVYIGGPQGTCGKMPKQSAEGDAGAGEPSPIYKTLTATAAVGGGVGRRRDSGLGLW